MPESSVSEVDNMKSPVNKSEHLPNSPTFKQMPPCSPAPVKQVQSRSPASVKQVPSPKTKPLPLETPTSKTLLKETIEFCKGFNQFQDRIKVEYQKLLKEMNKRDREVRR